MQRGIFLFSDLKKKGRVRYPTIKPIIVGYSAEETELKTKAEMAKAKKPR